MTLERQIMQEKLQDVIALLRAIIDQSALKNIQHLPDGGEALRLACLDGILNIRSILAEVKT